MVDRIKDIWGERTPHPRGTVWPARLDQHLDEGLVESDVDEPPQSSNAETSRQLTWLNTRMKVAAPQALIVAP